MQLQIKNNIHPPLAFSLLVYLLSPLPAIYRFHSANSICASNSIHLFVAFESLFQ